VKLLRRNRLGEVHRVSVSAAIRAVNRAKLVGAFEDLKEGRTVRAGGNDYRRDLGAVSNRAAGFCSCCWRCPCRCPGGLVSQAKESQGV
jgi:hypothetical protein